MSLSPPSPLTDHELRSHRGQNAQSLWGRFIEVSVCNVAFQPISHQAPLNSFSVHIQGSHGHDISGKVLKIRK